MFNRHVRHGSAGLLAVLGIVLAGCASVPQQGPVGLGGSETAHKFNTGRVTLVISDFNGQPLSRARVDIESAGGDDYYRTAAMSDYSGRVSFAGVPEQVRISVYHAESQGNYSREFVVPSSGTTELQMLVETFR
jgi:hypothetical protein